MDKPLLPGETRMLKKGDRVRKTADAPSRTFPRSNTGTVIGWRKGFLMVHVDNYALSTCTGGGWHSSFWEKIP